MIKKLLKGIILYIPFLLLNFFVAGAKESFDFIVDTHGYFKDIFRNKGKEKK